MQADAPFQFTPSGVAGQRRDPKWGSFYEYRIDRVDVDPDGYDLWYDGTPGGAYTTWYLRREAAEAGGVVPAAGSVIRIYQHAPFCRIDGITIDGHVVKWTGPHDHQAEADHIRAAAIARDPGMAAVFAEMDRHLGKGTGGASLGG